METLKRIQEDRQLQKERLCSNIVQPAEQMCTDDAAHESADSVDSVSETQATRLPETSLLQVVQLWCGLSVSV